MLVAKMEQLSAVNTSLVVRAKDLETGSTHVFKNLKLSQSSAFRSSLFYVNIEERNSANAALERARQQVVHVFQVEFFRYG
jgi:hypothetical protein